MRYLISGYYGEGNAGDEAILAGILQEVGRRDPEAHFTVLSFDPADTLKRHGDRGDGPCVEAISTSLRSPVRLQAAMRAADLLISGGGSFLHEADFEIHGKSFLFRAGKLRPVPYFLSVVLMARAARLPVMWYAQGLGPLHTRSARRLVAVAGSTSQAVTWRDEDSARLAYEVGVRAPLQMVVPDPAYALTPAASAAPDELLAASGLDKTARFLAVAPRPWLGRTGYLETVGGVLEEVGSALDLAIVFVPFHESQDVAVCETLAARPGFAGRAHVLRPVASPSLLAAALGRAELVVAMRLHSGILAATAGTPAVTIDYDPKTRAFATQTRQERWAIAVDRLEVGARASDDRAGESDSGSGAAALRQAITDTLSNLQERRAALERAVAPLRADAGRTAQLAVQLAAGKGRVDGEGGRTPWDELTAGETAPPQSNAW